MGVAERSVAMRARVPRGMNNGLPRQDFRRRRGRKRREKNECKYEHAPRQFILRAQSRSVM